MKKTCPVSSTRRLAASLLLGLCLLTGCDTQLVANLTEQDANQVLSVLLAAQIDASKVTRDAGKTWVVQVPETHIVQSLELLRANGLPQNHYANLGEMFKKDGLVSTPVEERVRFIYGVSQELSETLMKMDGVIAARVHIVMPQSDRLASAPKPASASVFIKHRQGMQPSIFTAPVKNLVAHSVEGLSYDSVSVVLVEALPVVLTPQPPVLTRMAAYLPWAVPLILFLAACAWLVMSMGHVRLADWPSEIGKRFTRLRTPSEPGAASAASGTSPQAAPMPGEGGEKP